MSQDRPINKTRKKTLLTDYRQPHPLSTAPVEGAKYPAQLMWDQTLKGKITLKVNDGIWKEGGAGKTNHKEVEMDYMHRNMLFEALLEATTDANFSTKQIPVQWKQFVFAGGQSKMSDQPVVQVFLTIVRDKAGCISLVWTKGDYKVTFKFKGPKETTVYVKNAEGIREEDHGLMSRWTVRAWIAFHRPMLDRMENDAWEPPVPKEGAGGGGGGSQRSAPAQSNDGFDDDDVLF